MFTSAYVNDFGNCTGTIFSRAIGLVYNVTEAYTSRVFTTVDDSATYVPYTTYNTTYATSKSRYYYRAHLTAALFIVQFKQEQITAETTTPPALPSASTSGETGPSTLPPAPQALGY